MAKKLSTFEVANAIVKSYAKSLVQMESRTKVIEECENREKHDEMIKHTLEKTEIEREEEKERRSKEESIIIRISELNYRKKVIERMIKLYDN